MKTITDNTLADILDNISQGEGDKFAEMFVGGWQPNTMHKMCESFLHKFGALKDVKVVGVIEHTEDDMPEDGSYFSWKMENFPDNL